MKVLKVIILVFLSLIVTASVLIAGLVAANFVKNAEFYLHSERGCQIPDIYGGFVPEGYCEAPDGTLISGYLEESGQARVYIIKEDGTVSHTDLVDEFYEPFISRASGIEVFDGYMYITGDEGLYMFYYEDVRDGLAEADYYGIVETFVKPEWCAIYEGNLYVGSRDGESAPDWQKNSTEAEEYTELITVFRLDERVKFAIMTRPVAAIASPSCVEGAYISYDGIVLSISRGAFDSRLVFYPDIIGGEEKIFLYAEDMQRAVPLYYLAQSEITHEITLPPMVEDVVFTGDRLHLFFDSAAENHKFGRFFLLDSTFSIEIKKEYFEK